MKPTSRDVKRLNKKKKKCYIIFSEVDEELRVDIDIGTSDLNNLNAIQQIAVMSYSLIGETLNRVMKDLNEEKKGAESEN